MGIVLELTGSDTTSFDDTEINASRATGIESIIIKTGNGTAHFQSSGDGHVDVVLEYIVDGGGTVVIGSSDKKFTLSIGFLTSLEIQSNNSNAGPQNSSELSLTGVMR